MQLSPDTTTQPATQPTTQPTTQGTARAISRWALPAALFLAITTMGSAHGSQAPADHVAEFDPGSVCSSVSGPTVAEEPDLSQLVITAHAASVHAAR